MKKPTYQGPDVHPTYQGPHVRVETQRWRRPVAATIVGLTACVVALGVVAAMFVSPDQTTTSSSPPAAASPATPEVSKGLGANDVSADVRLVDLTHGEFGDEVRLEIVNRSGKPSDYYIELVLLDKHGTNVGWTNATAQHVEPGQHATVTAPVIEDGAARAKITKVQRTASS
jgi:hypothetical protein